MAIFLPIVSEFRPAGVQAAEKSLRELDRRTSSFGASLKKAGRVAGGAFLGIGAAAGGAAYAGVALAKAAAEDAAAAAQLERQLKNTTGATDAQVAAVEKFISQTALATGVADDELRPALAALVRASGDVTTAQDDLALAMDISAGTGKSLDSVTAALAKAYGGSTTALKKLDPQLAGIIAKGGSTDEIFGRLGKTFAGAGDAAAESADGQFRRLTVAFDEAKESLGQKLLPIILRVVKFITTRVVPVVEKLMRVFDKRGLAGVWDLVANAARDAFPKVVAFLGDMLGKVRDVLVAAGRAFLEWIGPRIGPMLRQLGELIGKAANWILDEGLPMLVDKLKELGAAFVEWIGPRIGPMLRELAKLLVSILRWIVTDALPKLTAQALELGVAMLGWIAQLVPKAVAGLAGFIAELVPKLPGIFLTLVQKMAEVGASIGSGLLDALVGALKNLGSFATDIGRTLANGIIGFVNAQVIDRINELLEFTIDPPGPGSLTLNPPDIPRIPQLATGGIVRSPTTALIGEAGPEAVIPLDRLRSGGGDVYVTVNGALDPVQVARQIRQLLNDDSRRRIGSAVLA